MVLILHSSLYFSARIITSVVVVGLLAISDHILHISHHELDEERLPNHVVVGGLEIYHFKGQVLLPIVIVMPYSNCQIDLAKGLRKHVGDDPVVRLLNWVKGAPRHAHCPQKAPS
jgi:hypothetical protein